MELTAPDKREVELAASRFPTAHMMEVISRAKKGESLFEARIFDGSDSGDKTLITSTFGRLVRRRKTPPMPTKASAYIECSIVPMRSIRRRASCFLPPT